MYGELRYNSQILLIILRKIRNTNWVRMISSLSTCTEMTKRTKCTLRAKPNIYFVWFFVCLFFQSRWLLLALFNWILQLCKSAGGQQHQSCLYCIYRITGPRSAKLSIYPPPFSFSTSELHIGRSLLEGKRRDSDLIYFLIDRYPMIRIRCFILL